MVVTAVVKHCYTFIKKKINAYIPNFGQYKSEREGLCSTKKKTITNVQKPEGKQCQTAFQRRKKDSKGYTNARTGSETDCKTVPKRTMLWKNNQVQNQTTASTKEHTHDRMHQKLTQNAEIC